MDYSSIQDDAADASPWGNSPATSPQHNQTSFREVPASPSRFPHPQPAGNGDDASHPNASPFGTPASAQQPNLAAHTPSSDDVSPHHDQSIHGGIEQQSNQGVVYEERQEHPQHQQQHQQQARRPQQPQWKLQGKITGLERTGRKDLILRFDVYVSICAPSRQ